LAFECDHCLSFLFKGKGRSIWRLKVRALSSCGLNFKTAIAWDRNAKGDRFLMMGRGDRFLMMGRGDRCWEEQFLGNSDRFLRMRRGDRFFWDEKGRSPALRLISQQSSKTSLLKMNIRC